MSKKFFSAVTTAAMLALASSSARAVDDKQYGGGFCQTTSTSAEYTWGGIFNRSTSVGLGVECPIVQDTWNGIGSAHIWVTDQNFNQEVGCTLFSASAWGQGFSAYSVTRRSVGTSPLRQRLSFTGLSHTGANGGYYFIHCTVPMVYGGQRSGVSSYTVSER